MSRNSHAISLLGDSSFNRLQTSKVLVIGSGGIGCELLKNLVLSGFRTIELVDLDTIDLSNLNRQFLFQKQHINQSKAKVAAEAALKFNPDVQITSHHSSIFDDHFNLEWFSNFDIVLNALDNLSARRHVNLMCLASNTPVIESGTQGYEGQVTIHVPKKFQCFECEPSPTPKTYPVCTIRSTPSAPIHCIVWAKSYLLSQLFGDSQEQEKDETQTSSDDDTAKELENLKKEASALKTIRNLAGKPKYVETVFKKVFVDDIERLRSTESLWNSRPIPNVIPLDDFIKNKNKKSKEINKNAGIQRDHGVWTVDQNIQVFNSSLNILAKRFTQEVKKNKDFYIDFEKDDDDIMDFVTATANLRAHVFGIEVLSRFKIKEMAGSIIPAIATTNAIIAGMIVIQAIKVLTGKLDECKYTYLVRGGTRPFQGHTAHKPLETCTLCNSDYYSLQINTDSTLEQFLTLLRKEKNSSENGGFSGLGIEEEITVQENGRLLFDVEFEDNLQKSMNELGIGHGKRVMISEDEPGKFPIVVSIYKSDLNVGEGNFKSFQFSNPSRKRTREGNENVETTKRIALDELK
ncbi:E1 ubiquitin-activating protein uba2 [Nowakowskiella sp. JEL0078]|nr:E1 ubiquitin-activating protein uba2 [Nowakowskiella sp. JEL0078]